MIQKLQAALKGLEMILIGSWGNRVQSIDFFTHTLIRPMLFLWYSFLWLLRPLFLWSVLSVISIYALTFVVDESFSHELSPGAGIFFTSNTLVFIIYFILALVSFLALPSNYGHHAITDKELKAAIVVFREGELFSNIEVTQKYLEISEKAAKARVKVWMGISGFLWTLCLFELRLIVGADNVSSDVSIMPMLAATMISLLIAAVYLKGISKLFTLAQLALASGQVGIDCEPNI